jgi:5-methylcytosine-specific restriction endonuclease McrA
MSVGHLCRRCGEYVPAGDRCACELEIVATRRRVYEAKRWREFTRPVVLARELGLCQKCGDRGTVVDHVLPIETLLALDRSPFDPLECQLLCLHCSGRKDGARAHV